MSEIWDTFRQALRLLEDSKNDAYRGLLHGDLRSLEDLNKHLGYVVDMLEDIREVVQLVLKNVKKIKERARRTTKGRRGNYSIDNLPPDDP